MSDWVDAIQYMQANETLAGDIPDATILLHNFGGDTMKSIVVGVISIFLLASAPVTAQEIRKERVQFKPGEIGATMKGHLKGAQTVDYLLSAKSGQTLVVILEASNPSTYFNVTAPGTETALFIGSTSGNRFVGNGPKDGDYTVRVYLMRNAARRGAKATYTINFAIADNDQSTAAIVPRDTASTKYDASGKVKCSAGTPTLDQWCGFRVVRDLPKKTADIWVENIALQSEARYRFLHYENNVFTTDDKAKLSWQRQDDNWWVSVDGKEFYLIPDALIHGG